MKIFSDTPKFVPSPSEPASAPRSLNGFTAAIPEDIKVTVRSVDLTGLKVDKTMQKIISDIQSEEVALDMPLGEPGAAPVKYGSLSADQRTKVNEALRTLLVSAKENGLMETESNNELTEEVEKVGEFMSGLYSKLAKHVQQTEQTPEVETPAPVLANTIAEKPITANQTPVQYPLIQPQPDPEITERDKQRFIVAVLANEPFTETVELFGGALSITYQSLNAQTIDMLACALSSSVEDTTIPSVLRQSFVTKYSLAAQTVSVFVNGKKIVLPTIEATNDFQALSQQFFDRYNALTKVVSNTAILNAVTDAVAKFNQKCQFLSSKAFDVNFWQPIL